MLYLKIQDYFDFIFDFVRRFAYDDIKKPLYEKDKKGIKELSSLLELIQNDDYYPDFFKKAAYFLVALSTGHYFENGNKRIALYSYIVFSHLNGYRYRGISLKEYRLWFKKYFPNYQLSKQKFSSNAGWALSNFNKAINMKSESHSEGHSYDFNQLKEITEDFIRLISRKKV